MMRYRSSVNGAARGALALLAIAGVAVSLALAPTARGQDINWIDPLGGGFQDNLNWNTQTVPGAANSAVFNLSNAGYSALFSANATNAGLRVLDDVVTLDLNGFQYTVNTTISLTDAAGQTARLTIKNGTLQANGASGVVIGSDFSDGTLIISGSGTQLLATNDLHVGGDTAAGSTGALTVENEAVAQPTGGLFVGRFDGNLGTATVTGAGSAILVGGAMNVGLGGTSLLTVTGGGLVSERNPTPWDVGPFGTVDVTAGGILRTGGTITPGGLSTIGAIGTALGGAAEVNVLGSGSRWELTGPASIGELCPALLMVDNGGLVDSRNPDPLIVGTLGTVTVTIGGIVRTGGSITPGGTTTIGTAAGGGTATVNITGVAARWETFGPTNIGTAGDAVVIINSGGFFETKNPTPWIVGPGGLVPVGPGGTLITGGTALNPGGTTTIGAAGVGTATVNVDGLAALWDAFGPVNIGTAGDAAVSITGGGGLVQHRDPTPWIVGPDGLVTVATGGSLTTNGPASVGTVAGGTATVTVTDAASQWIGNNSMAIGTGGPGTLTINSGGVVSVIDPDIYNVGPFGTVNVNAGSTLRTGGTITPGGLSTLGTAPGGTATATVGGAGALWETFGPTNIGTGGPGTLTISSGGLVSETNPLPYDVGPFGTVNVNAGSILRTGGTLTPGGTTTIGTAAGGTAILFVGGAGARWEASGPVSIGQSGQASLAFSGGGVVEIRDPDPWDVGPLGFVSVVAGAILRTGGTITPGGTSTLGTAPGGTGQLFVTGTGSRWELFGPTNIGTGGPGQLTVNSGGVVSSGDPEPFDVGPFGTVNVNGGGTLFTGGPVRVGTVAGGTARLNVDGGFWFSFGDVTVGLTGAAAAAADEPIRALSASAGFFEREERSARPKNPAVALRALIKKHPAVAQSKKDPALALRAQINAAAAQAAPDSPRAAVAGGPFVGEVMANGTSGTFLELTGLIITDGGCYSGEAGSSAAMSAKSVEVRGSGNGGRMDLSSNMSATIATSMRVDGTAFPCGPLRGCTPPILRVADNAFLQAASMDVLAGRVELTGGSIAIAGAVTIDDGGAVVADSLHPLSTFTAGSITVGSTSGIGGRLEFGGTMESNVGGNLTISGCGGALRGCTPPILRVRGTAVVTVAGDFGIGGSAQVNVAAGPTFNLAGNFFNFSTTPTTFDWSAGSLTMNGVLSQFELAGENRGVNPSAFVDNFAIGTVRIAPGSIVEFSDLFDNVPGAGCEALYVDTLSLGVGSVINVNSCLVYYQNLVIDPGGATILTGGGGALVCLTPGDLNCDGLVDLNDAAAMVTALIDPAADPQATAAANLNGDGTTDGEDIQTMVDLLLGL